MTARVSQQRSEGFIFQTAAFAIIYAVSGYLGWLLKSPGDQSVVIWPAAGIAVGMLIGVGRRIWPGVPIGIFILNLWIVHVAPPSGDIGLMMEMPGIAALAGSVQALIAVTLVKRRFGSPVRLDGARDMLLVLAYAGPVACAVSALIGTLGGYAYALLPMPSLGLAWLKLWIGSSLGVLIFLPLALITIAPDDGRLGVIWKGEELGHVLTPLASFILLSGIFLSAFLANAINLDNAQSHRKMFALAASRNEAHLLHEFASLKGVLDEAAERIGDNPDRHFSRWQQFVHPSLVNRLHGLEAIGMLRFSRRGTSMRAATQIMGKASDTLAQGTPKVEFSAPFGMTKSTRPLQILSGDGLAAAARASIETDNPVAAEAVVSMRSSPAARRILVVEPVVAGGHLRGWAFLVLNPHEIFPPSSPDDVGAFLHRLELIGWIGPQELHPAIFLSSAATASPRHQSTTSLVDFGRSWLLTWDSTPGFDASANHREGRLALIGGVLVTLLVAGLVQTLSSRENSVRREVDRRTEELAHELRKNKSIVENAAVGILLLMSDGTIASANPACVTILGLPVEQLLNQNIVSILPVEFIESAVEAARAGAPIAELREIEVTLRSGGQRWLEVRLSSFEGEAGAPTITLILKDVTDAVLAMEKLTATESRWNLALEGSQIGVFDLDLSTGRAEASDAWRRLIGIPISADVDIEAEWEARVHPDDLERVQQADRECFAGKTDTVFVEYRLRRRDGEWRWMRGAARVVEWDSEGHPLRYLGTMMDITELKDALDRARSSENDLADLINTAPVGMAVLGLDGSFLVTNDAFCRFTGYSKEFLTQTRVQDLSGADYLRKNSEEVRRLLRGKVRAFSDERRFVREDGTEVWGLLTRSILRGRPGEPPRFIAQILDISEAKQLEIMKGDFVATVSHELRTPLTSINGSLGLVLGAMSDGLPEKVKHLLSVANQNGERLLHLVNDLLDMQRLSSGRMALERVDVEVRGLVAQAVEEAQGYAAKFKVSFELDLPSEAVKGRIDANRFKQVLSNLLSNAAKFSHEGGAVRTSVERDGDEITISVADHGRGIPPNSQHKIFRPFSQVASASVRDREGSGLGLVISKEIVEQMGGAIGFESEPNVRTRFWVTIPLFQPGKHTSAGHPAAPVEAAVRDGMS